MVLTRPQQWQAHHEYLLLRSGRGSKIRLIKFRYIPFTSKVRSYVSSETDQRHLKHLFKFLQEILGSLVHPAYLASENHRKAV